MKTPQLDLWRSKFGKDYARRSCNVVEPENQRRLMRDWARMLRQAFDPSPSSGLEVGCNIGRNLLVLRHLLEKIHAVEPNHQACEAVRQNSDLRDVLLHEGDGFNLPYGDDTIDLAFTSGVLIHVAPDDLGKMTDEIVRVARYYVLCIEYFSDEPESVPYHSMDGYLFKRDYGLFYHERYPELRIVDYGFLWQPVDSADNCNWWLFRKS